MIQFKPGNLITLQPSHPIGEGLNLVVEGSDYTEVRWIKRNTIGVFIKLTKQDSLGGGRSLCLFGEDLVNVSISNIQPYKED